jgi:hypothetical protein
LEGEGFGEVAFVDWNRQHNGGPINCEQYASSPAALPTETLTAAPLVFLMRANITFSTPALAIVELTVDDNAVPINPAAQLKTDCEIRESLLYAGTTTRGVLSLVSILKPLSTTESVVNAGHISNAGACIVTTLDHRQPNVTRIGCIMGNGP